MRVVYDSSASFGRSRRRRRRRRWRWRWRWKGRRHRNDVHPIGRVWQRCRCQRGSNPQCESEKNAGRGREPDTSTSSFGSQIHKLQPPQDIVGHAANEPEQHVTGDAGVRLHMSIVLRLPQIRFDFRTTRVAQRLRHASRVESSPQTDDRERHPQHDVTRTPAACEPGAPSTRRQPRLLAPPPHLRLSRCRAFGQADSPGRESRDLPSDS
jgi:hypothetical protein